MHIREDELDNILMAQKDAILEQLNEAIFSEDCRDVVRSIQPIQEILSRLSFVLRLWNEANYGYKGLEICGRIERALRNTVIELHHAASSQRRDLNNAIARCCELYGQFRSLRDEPRDTPSHSSLASQMGAFESGNVCYQ